MNPLKKLATQTGLYGLPSILGRLLNYLLVPIYTEVFLPAEYGVVSYLYSAMAFLNILYTYGMETAYFRFTAKHKSEIYYHQSATAILISSTVFSGIIFFFSQQIAGLANIPDKPELVYYMAAILFIDAIVAIPLARLRNENKAKKFAFTRMSSIVLNILFTTSFLLFFPFLSKKGFLDWPLKEELEVQYVFLANLLSNAVMVIILYKEIFSIKLKLNWVQFKPALTYALPVLVMGLAGMANEQFCILIFQYVLPENFYEGVSGTGATGILNATIKLSIFMMLAVQAFRYAGEPFFFSQAEDKNAPALFAKVFYYFIALCLVIWVGVSLNADLIGSIFLSNKEYRSVLYLVPVFLLGKLFFGAYINLSIWFKLTDKTYYGVYYSLMGAAITIAGNFILIPYIGYSGVAITSVLAYLIMVLACYFVGQKHFYIPYPVKRIGIMLVSAALVIALFFYFKPVSTFLNYFLGIVITLLFTGALILLERKRIFQETV